MQFADHFCHQNAPRTSSGSLFVALWGSLGPPWALLWPPGGALWTSWGLLWRPLASLLACQGASWSQFKQFAAPNLILGAFLTEFRRFSMNSGKIFCAFPASAFFMFSFQIRLKFSVVFPIPPGISKKTKHQFI